MSGDQGPAGGAGELMLKHLRPSEREELHALAIAYCERHGCTRQQLAQAAAVSANLVSQLQSRAVARVMRANGDRLRAFIDSHPAGLDGVAVLPPKVMAKPSPTAEERIEAIRRSAADEAAASVAARRAAGRTGGMAAGADLSVRERVAAAVIDSPRELARMVERRWPELLQRVFTAAREEARDPGEMILSLLDDALDRRVA